MFRTTFRSDSTSIFLMVLTAAVALALTATATEAASPSGACVSARVEAPFRLPDGSVHAAGTLMICQALAFSPVATVHRTYVNGRPVGMFVSKIRRAESKADGVPSVVFQRGNDGPLELLGFVMPGQERDVSYQFSVGHYREPSSVLAGPAGSLALVAAAE